MEFFLERQTHSDRYLHARIWRWWVLAVAGIALIGALVLLATNPLQGIRGLLFAALAFAMSFLVKLPLVTIEVRDATLLLRKGLGSRTRRIPLADIRSLRRSDARHGPVVSGAAESYGFGKKGFFAIETADGRTVIVAPFDPEGFASTLPQSGNVADTPHALSAVDFAGESQREVQRLLQAPAYLLFLAGGLATTIPRFIEETWTWFDAVGLVFTFGVMFVVGYLPLVTVTRTGGQVTVSVIGSSPRRFTLDERGAQVHETKAGWKDWVAGPFLTYFRRDYVNLSGKTLLVFTRDGKRMTIGTRQ